MADATWTMSIKDDVSKTSAKMAFSLTALDKTASDLFRKSNGNFRQFETNMKKAGVDAIDARLVTEKYRKELVATRQELLGLGKVAVTTSRSMREVATGALRGIGEKALSVPGMLVSGAVGAVQAIGEKVFDVGKDLVTSVIDAAQFRANALSGLEYMLGSRREAEQIFAEAQRLAADTPLDTDKVITGIKQLVTAGFSGKDSMLLFKSVADQASKFQDDEQMQDKVIQAFSRVKGRGVATGEDLESFRVAGFRAEDIVNELRRKKNLASLFKGIKKDASQEEVIKQVKKVLGEGKIGSTTFLNAAIASQERGKGNIGSFASEMGAKSLTGTISNFRTSFKDLLKSVNIQDWAGVKQFQDFLTRITKMLQGDAGKGLLKTVENIFNALMSGLDRIQANDMDEWLAKLTTFGNEAVAVIEKAWTWFDRLMHGDVNVGDDLGDVLLDMGAYIGEGVLKGMKEGATGLGRSEKKFIETYGASKGDFETFLAGRGITDPTEQKAYLKKHKELLPQFYAAGAAGEISSSNTGGMDLLNKMWKFAEVADTVAQRMKETADRQALLDTLDTGQYGAGKGGGGVGMATGSIRDLNIPKLAEGGFVMSPTLAWVGDKGPEAVVPLRTMAGNGQDILPLNGRSGAAMGGRSIGTLNVAVNVGSLSGMGDPTQAANTIADITVERLMLAVLERKALEA